jgi:hypothetical protein
VPISNSYWHNCSLVAILKAENSTKPPKYPSHSLEFRGVGVFYGMSLNCWFIKTLRTPVCVKMINACPSRCTYKTKVIDWNKNTSFRRYIKKLTDIVVYFEIWLSLAVVPGYSKDELRKRENEKRRKKEGGGTRMSVLGD